jgi:shikimate kinase
MRIYLVGFMGAGKTTVGRCLASRLGCTFVDLDSEIEHQAQMSIPMLFEREGEAGFRERESAALRSLAERERVVVATGGGTLTTPGNLELIRSSGRSVFVDPPLELLFERVERSARVRPLFRDREQARCLFEQRLAAYRGAELVVPVTALDRAEQVAERIARRLGENAPCAT